MELRIGELGRGDLEEACSLLEAACAFDPAHTVADEKLFGPSLARAERFGAWRGETLVGVAVLAGRWLRLLAVAPDARRTGVGSRLLAAAIATAKAAGAPRLRTADEPGNYLAPGVDTRNVGTLEWLERRGFVRVGENVNLSVPLIGNPLVATARLHELIARVEQLGYAVRRAEEGDATRLTTFAARHFSAAWAFELERALVATPAGVHLATRGADLVAFAAHDGNNRGLGWFGPAGTMPDHRGRGLGEVLLISCLADVAAAGHREGEIAWIGPRAFYGRACGALPGRRFVVLELAL